MARTPPSESGAAADRSTLEAASLALAAEAAGLGVWDWDLASNRITYSPRAKSIMGWGPGEAVTFEMVRAAVHPDDLAFTVPMSERALDPAIREQAPYEYRIRRPDGATRWVLAHGLAIFAPDAGGEVRAVRYVGSIQDITERKRVDEALRESEERLRAMADNLPHGMIYQITEDEPGTRRFTYLSSSCERINGISVAAAMADAEVLYSAIHPEDAARLADAELAGDRAGTGVDIEIRGRTPDGAWRWYRIVSAPRVTASGQRVWDGIQIDVDPRHRAEEALIELNAKLEDRVAEEVARRLEAEAALRQAQKMEAVGQLTGGVAHDFNNLLTLIIGGLEMIGRAPASDEARIRRAAAIALEGAERAAALTGRLLAFSRRQPLQPRPLDLNTLIGEILELIRRAVGERIEVEWRPAEGLWTIEADHNQLENAILNLAINARDAMPEGGTLWIETANVADGPPGGAQASPCVLVQVRDTGVGMDAQALDRAFEPFFTTKPADQGGGLGLSMVYGFVRQSGGEVALDSAPGVGTTARLYFPRVEAAAGPDRRPEGEDGAIRGGGERVLVVEDNDRLRAFAAEALEELGYRVSQAREADTALRLIASTRPHLLLTDIVLPGMSGKALADAVRRDRPDVKVLLTTGYAGEAIGREALLDPDLKLLAKPFTRDELARRVRVILDSG